MDINAIWQIIAPYVTAVLGALGGGTVMGLIGKGIAKTIANKLTNAEVIKTTTENVVDKIVAKPVKVEIDGAVDTYLKKLGNANAENLEEMKKINLALIDIIATFATYFADSYTLSDDKKVALNRAIHKARKLCDPRINDIEVAIEPAKVEEPKVKAKDENKNNNDIIR